MGDSTETRGERNPSGRVWISQQKEASRRIMSLPSAITLVRCRMFRKTVIDSLCAGDDAWEGNKDGHEGVGKRKEK
jgi:hypothetical protein